VSNEKAPGIERAGPTEADAATFRPERGTLYVVATPLGNLRDITLRALDVLSQVDVIAAEDTRVTSVLLARFGISRRPTALHAHNEARRAGAIIDALASGKSVALVTDAGTPAISDPGARLVRAVRDARYAVVPIPGPSAAVTAISAAGLSAERFVFVGFLPSAAKARDALLAELASAPFALVIY
jgi:16S rRNA (cytidine1402-2'-O)-methyltransferase